MQLSQKKFKEANWLLQQYNSPRCWNTVEKALTEFTKLSSHTQKLRIHINWSPSHTSVKYVKEQLLMWYLGCGWVEAHHAWSKDSVSIYYYKVIGSFGQNNYSTGKSKVSSRGSTVWAAEDIRSTSIGYPDKWLKRLHKWIGRWEADINASSIER